MRSSKLIFALTLLIAFSCSDKDQIKPSSTQSNGSGNNNLGNDGLGNNLTQSVSNDRSYEWYFDQGNSGTYANVNCGPTSTTMAIKWVTQSFALTPQDARAKYRPAGGWWYTSDILSYLSDNTVSNFTISLTDISLLKNQLDNGNIVILCLDMFYVNPQLNSTYHVDKFYGASTRGWGHFIVIKGYKVVDSQVFYEAYDPYSFGVEYTDNSLKGKDRYYRSANLDAATNNWWDYAIVIQKSSGGAAMKAPTNAVNPERIQHMSGQ